MQLTYADKLRWLADYLDDHPEIRNATSEWDYPTTYIYADDWDHFQELVPHLEGYDKDGSNGSLSARHSKTARDGETIYIVTVHVSGVCEATPVVDDDGQPVMKPRQKYVETDEMVPVLEYKCPEVWSK